MDLNLIGKTALVTAASGGIGGGVAEALAEAGVRVAISGRTRSSLETLADRLASSAGGRPAIVVGDVSAKDGPAQIAAGAGRPSAAASYPCQQCRRGEADHRGGG
jgi:3-oxoacyl-[acyl-carrier protein] reductase